MLIKAINSIGVAAYGRSSTDIIVWLEGITVTMFGILFTTDSKICLFEIIHRPLRRKNRGLYRIIFKVFLVS